ncbi:MAG: peptidoglycan/LPS O-acetylase OafA/YrhL [Phenylobacterium sp.]|jgi:peptidoglycan/LPS O-acetylase OafA/YrhL
MGTFGAHFCLWRKMTNKKYQSLESLRGIAAVLVVLYHSGFVWGAKNPLIAQGSLFVYFFFVLSGFVMAYAYLDKIGQGFSAKKFFLLRFGRIYPLHLFMLMVWLVFVLVKATAYHQFGIGSSDPLVKNTVTTFISHLLLTNSLGFHDSANWNFPAWSISVEFYTCLLFFAVISLFKFAAKPIFSLVVSVVAFSLLFAVNGGLLFGHYDASLWRCIGGFFLGVFTYALSKNRQFRLNARWATVFELLAIGVMLMLVINNKLSWFVRATAFISFAVVIWLFAIQSKGLISQLLLRKPMLYIGSLSYSIYMVHAIVFAVFGIVWQYILKLPVTIVERVGHIVKVYDTPYAHVINLLALLLVTGISVLTYRWIEMPWRDRFRVMARGGRA